MIKKMNNFFVLSIFAFFFPVLLIAQSRKPVLRKQQDMIIRSNSRKVEIPFEYDNNFIIVKVLFNGTFPLKFIFDTGAEHTILTKREITDLLQINYQREFKVMGSDMETVLTAYLAQGVNMQLNTLYAANRSILVLEDDYFKFEEFAGINVQGVLGADFFRRFVVEINYRRRVITLIDPAHFKPPSKLKAIDVEIQRNKPYLQTQTAITPANSLDTKLLIDTGASIAYLIHTNTHPDLKLPEQVILSNIGMGLGGFIEGFMGRIHKLDIGGHELQQVTTNFQDVSEEIDSAYLNQRNGIIGNVILSRFTVTIDYIHDKMYLQPNKEFKKKFKHDRSGLMLANTGPSLNTYTVFFVTPGSPADEAGIQKGDEIRTFRNLPASFVSLVDINKKLRGKPGKTIKLGLKRGEEKFKVKFKLRELI